MKIEHDPVPGPKLNKILPGLSRLPGPTQKVIPNTTRTQRFAIQRTWTQRKYQSSILFGPKNYLDPTEISKFKTTQTKILETSITIKQYLVH